MCFAGLPVMAENLAHLPMFPLGSVVFPFTAIPLRVFEVRYQDLLDSVLDGDRRFGTVLIERGFEVGGGDARFGVGTLVELVGVQDMDQGHRAIVVAGLERIRVKGWLEEESYPVASVDLLAQGHAPAQSDIDRLSASLHRVLALASEMGADVLATADLEVSENPLAAAYQLVALAPLTPLDDQRLLEIDDPVAMVDTACELLREQATTLTAQLGSA